MTDGNGTTIRIHVLRIVVDAELPQRRQTLRSECLVELDDIHLPDAQPREPEHLVCGRHRADAHDAGFDAGGRPGNNPRDRLEALLARGRAFGESRNVCNAHWYSDVVAGRLVGAAADDVVATGTTEHVWVEAATGKLRRMPEALRESFARLAG